MEDLNGNSMQPLLTTTSIEDESHQNQILLTVFTTNTPDIPPITSLRELSMQLIAESKKLFYLAVPAIFSLISKYSLSAFTEIFAGHLGTIELAAVSVEKIIAGFSFGIMLGMASALETLCGQAVGRGKVDMLGVYMQRSWLILICMAFPLCLLYIFAGPMLKLIGQTAEISEAAGTFAIWMIPQLFAYAVNFPVAKFLQAQSKVAVIAIISGIAMVLHPVFCWLFMVRLRWGLVGAAVVLNGTWRFIVVAQLVYVFSGRCRAAWGGFSWGAFQNLWEFFRLSLASALMLCLEIWYFMALILFAGYLKNAEISVDAFSICLNILGWTVMASLGMNVAVSVRVSNELGAFHPRTARFSLVVAVVTSVLIGLLLALVLIITRDAYPSLFSNDTEVKDLVKNLTPLLVFCVVINNVQPVLSGVAIGAGWQAAVAYVNIACYYFFGIPVGLVLGYKVNLGVKGIWCGMMSGTILQTFVLLVMVYKTNWNKEASLAEDRIRNWGGHQEATANNIENAEET